MSAVYDLVVFDIGGVLVQAHHTWAGALGNGAFPFDPHERWNGSFFDLPEYLPHEAGRITEEEYLRAVAAYAGLSGAEEARRLHEAILGPEFPGVLDVIRELKRAGVPTAAFSNNNPIHWHVLTDPARYPALAELDDLVSSHEIGAHKPEPEAFRAFERRLGAEGKRILFFEDNARNAEAARAVGWESHVVDLTQDRAPQIRAALSTRGLL